jgi:hypothetical protein
VGVVEGGIERLALHRCQGGPRPLQRAVDRGDGGVEQFGDLGGVPPEHLAQDEHRALARREVLQCGDEGQADGFARRGQLGRIAVGRDDAGVGNGG